MTLEYFEILDGRLTQDGIIVSNLIGTLSGDTSDLWRAVYKTMGQVFPMLHVFTTRDFGSGQVQNIMIVAGKTHVPYSESQLAAMLDEGSANVPGNNGGGGSGNTINFANRLVDDEEVITTDVPILTDQYAPVEQLLNPLTGRPYTIDEQIDAGQRDLPWTERGSTVFILLGLVALVWMWQFREIWKGKEQKIRSQ
jgi:hypothetical protein